MNTNPKPITDRPAPPMAEPGPDSQITEIRVDRTFNLGNYNNIKIGLTTTVGPNDDVDKLAILMDERLIKMRNNAKQV